MKHILLTIIHKQFHMLPVMKKQHGMQSEQISYIF